MKIAFYIFCYLNSLFLYATDTLKITIREADSLFLTRNYRLLAAEMNIQAAKAQILQARLFQDPVITAEFNALDPQNKEVAHIGKSGEKSFMIQQLIQIGGKRHSQIQVAKTNTVIAELEFQDLIRNIKFELHCSLYSLNQQVFLLTKYTKQLALIDTIISAYEVQVKKGNIPLKDLVRLKGVYLALNNDRSQVNENFFQQLAKVQTILQDTHIIIPGIDVANIDYSNKNLTIQSLLEEAESNRPDYLISLQNKILAGQYLRYQQQLAIPDLNVFSAYDQRGGAFINQVNVGVSMPLPMWNRNRGNIKASWYKSSQMTYENESFKNQVKSEVQQALAVFNQSVQEFRKARKMYNSDFETTLKGMSDNFLRGNVSLIEFVDFFESYNDAMAELSRVRYQLAISKEAINLSTGREIL